MSADTATKCGACGDTGWVRFSASYPGAWFTIQSRDNGETWRTSKSPTLRWKTTTEPCHECAQGEAVEAIRI